MQFQTHAQNLEDVVARDYLAAYGVTPKDLMFVDVGAADGVTFSNTRAFYELGSKGVVVEGSALAIRPLLDLYGPDPAMTIVAAAISHTDVPLAEFHTTPDLVSTTERSHRDKWASVAPFRTVYQPLVSVDSLATFLVNRGRHQLLSVDVEGTSVELFERFPLDAMGVLVAIVEYDDKLERLRGHAARVGFDVGEVTKENAVLKRRKVT